MNCLRPSLRALRLRSPSLLFPHRLTRSNGPIHARLTPRTTRSSISNHASPQSVTLPKTRQKDPNARYAYPERLAVYHIGTFRILVLAAMKLSSVGIFVFFYAVVLPSYIASEDVNYLHLLGFALCGIAPLSILTFTASPLATYIHMRLPPYARTSRPNLQRFARTLPATTPLDITTMGLLGRPRLTRVLAGDLKKPGGGKTAAAAAKGWSRFGLVNYVRDVTAENKTRKWYNFGAVGNFKIEDSSPTKAGWVWTEAAQVVGRYKS